MGAKPSDLVGLVANPLAAESTGAASNFTTTCDLSPFTGFSEVNFSFF
jgi:hypothetical protein